MLEWTRGVKHFDTDVAKWHITVRNSHACLLPYCTYLYRLGFSYLSGDQFSKYGKRRAAFYLPLRDSVSGSCFEFNLS
jgi:hypothetical protein